MATSLFTSTKTFFRFTTDVDVQHTTDKLPACPPATRHRLINSGELAADPPRGAALGARNTGVVVYIHQRNTGPTDGHSRGAEFSTTVGLHTYAPAPISSNALLSICITSTRINNHETRQKNNCMKKMKNENHGSNSHRLLPCHSTAILTCTSVYLH